MGLGNYDFFLFRNVGGRFCYMGIKETIKCLFKEHEINDITKRILRKDNLTIAYCINCGQKLLLNMHDIRPNSFYMEEI